MSELYTEDDVRVASIALHAMWTSHPDECLDCKDDVEPVLEAVAPAIAARALRDAADALDESSESVRELADRFGGYYSGTHSAYRASANRLRGLADAIGSES